MCDFTSLMCMLGHQAGDGWGAEATGDWGAEESWESVDGNQGKSLSLTWQKYKTSFIFLCPKIFTQTSVFTRELKYSGYVIGISPRACTLSCSSPFSTRSQQGRAVQEETGGEEERAGGQTGRTQSCERSSETRCTQAGLTGEGKVSSEGGTGGGGTRTKVTGPRAGGLAFQNTKEKVPERSVSSESCWCQLEPHCS